MTNITIYSHPVCPHCVRAKQLLDRRGLAYTEIQVNDSPGQLAQMLERSSGRRSVPQIFINDYHIGGADDLYAADQSGKLDQLLKLYSLT